MLKKEIAIYIIAAVLAVSGFTLAHCENKTELVPTAHTVKSGECLWTIAEQYRPEGITMDEYMSWVYEHNDSGVIYPGQNVVMGVVEE